MSWAAVAAAIGAAGSYLGSREERKGMENAARLTNEGMNGEIFQQIDLDALNKMVQDQARGNIEGSIGLEKEFDPFTAAMRELFPQQIYDRAQDTNIDRLAKQALGLVEGDLGQDVGQQIGVDPLFTQANQAAMEQLAQGGQLPDGLQQIINQQIAAQQQGAVPQQLQDYIDSALGNLGSSALPRDVQNLVARNAAQRAGRAGALGTGLGRDMAARDLGLTSLDMIDRNAQTAGNALSMGGQALANRAQDSANAASTVGMGMTGTNLANQRIGQAANIGQAGTNLNQVVNAFNANLEQQNRNNRTNTLSFLEGLGQSRRAETAGAIAHNRPQYGLDPASIADLYVSDINSLRNLEQQRLATQAQLAMGQGKSKGNMFGDIGGSLSGFLGSEEGGDAMSGIGGFFKGLF